MLSLVVADRTHVGALDTPARMPYSYCARRGPIGALWTMTEEDGMSEPQQSDTTTTPGGLFLRRSSGLVREFSPRDAFVFNVVAFAPGLSLALIPLSLALTVPNVDVFALIAVAVAFAIC